WLPTGSARGRCRSEWLIRVLRLQHSISVEQAQRRTQGIKEPDFRTIRGRPNIALINSLAIEQVDNGRPTRQLLHDIEAVIQEFCRGAVYVFFYTPARGALCEI